MSDPHSTPPPSGPPPGWREPPAAPPPDAPAADHDGGSLGRGLAWLLALILLLIPMGIAYLRKSDGDDAYAAGYTLGTGVLIVVLAEGIRRLWPRVVRGRAAPAAPLAVALAALIGIGAQFALRSAERDDPVEEVAELAADCAASDPDPFGLPGSGLQLVDLSEAEIDAFRAGAETVLPDGMSADRYELRRVVANGRPLGAVVAYPGMGSETTALDGFQRGVTASALPPGGGSIRQVTIAGGPAMLAEAPGVGVAVAANGCWGVAVMTRSAQDASALGESLLAG